MKTTGIKLDETLDRRLKSLAKLRDRSPHWIMKTAIIEYLEREEAYEREKQEDMARWDHYVHTGEYIEHVDMAAWLDELANKTPQGRED